MDIKFGGKIRDVERPEDGFDLRRIRFLQKCGRIGFGSAGSAAIRVTTRVVQVVDDGIGLGLHGDVGTVRRQFGVQLVSNVEHHAQHGHADRGRQAHGDRDQQSAFELPAERAENHSKKNMTTSFRSLEMRRQCVERRSLDYDFAGFNLIIERHRIASALESDSGEVDGDIALLADDLAILLVIARVTAVVTCVKTDTVRSTIFS